MEILQVSIKKKKTIIKKVKSALERISNAIFIVICARKLNEVKIMRADIPGQITFLVECLIEGCSCD